MQNFLSWTFKNIYISIWSCMLLEDVMQVLPLLMPPIFVDQFFSFGDMNNALRHWANSLHEHYIVLRIWNLCILHVEDCLWKKKQNIVHWQQLEQGHSKNSSVMVSSLNLLEDINCQRIRSNEWTLLLFVANIGWIAIGDDCWHPLWNHCQIF